MIKQICILGSGLVSGSVVNFFCRDIQDENLYSVTVGSIVDSELESLQKKYHNIKTILLDVTRDEEKLKELVQASDIVISLLTNEMQVPIAKVCISLKKHMVHASYCTKEMMALDLEAKANKVTILNELGLDPGIDHLLAMKAIDEIKKEDGSKITAFISYCGGLPEPKASKSNPLRYKFSWSPLTSLRNLLNSAKYLMNGKVVEILAGGYLIDAIKPSSDLFNDDEMIQLEVYPNRDSLIYKDLYGLLEANEVIRGTYRYRGFQKIIKAIFRLGLFSQESTKSFKENENINSWGDLILNLLSAEINSNIHEVLFHQGFEKTEIDMFEELGILSKITPLNLHDTLLETLADYLSGKLIYEPGERDMVIMRHEIRYEKPDNNKQGSCEKIRREITFVAYGEQDRAEGFSAMSKTVALTIGHAVILLLNGKIQRKGVVLPFTADIYTPILNNLKNEGLVFTEKITNFV